ncbi:MAG TPA: hypothetical protein VEK78_13100 [Gemmatimonadales bacterium]|nr:hypothetical protein [Gemmatimonadales bacterium]
MKRLALALALLAGGAARASAQGSTTEVLTQAHDFYERLDIERALALLRQIVSPRWPFEVTPEQRVAAYTYLGACLALVGKRDSAVLYFRAALEREPFTDLDPGLFTPAQLELFHRARRLTFAVAARPVASTRIDPRTERVSLTIVTTHAASLRAELRTAAAPSLLTLFDGESEGLREVAWNGLLGDGRLAPPGRYELVVAGRSRLLERTDSARVYFDVRHEVRPLEDTLPDLTDRELLPEQLPRSAATGELLKGLAVAASALVIADRLANRELGGGLPAGAGIVASTATVAGTAAFLRRRHHRDMPENVAENARRRAERAAANVAIQRRNAEKVAATVLLILPAAGVGP